MRAFIAPLSLAARPTRRANRCARVVSCAAPPMRPAQAAAAARLPEPLGSGHDQSAVVSGERVSFDYFEGDTGGGRPVVFFLPGFYYSTNRLAKATALGISAKRDGYPFMTMDYYGTGRSDGDFAEVGTMTRWVGHAIALMDEVAGDRPVVLVGTGVGGWVMLHVAMARKNVVGLVGVNVSVDFTEDLVRPRLTKEQEVLITQEGVVDLPWGRTSYPIGRALMDDARDWLCLRGAPASLPINRPVRLVHAMDDEEVPSSVALKLVESLSSDDVVLSLVKGGDHLLEEDDDFRRMWRAVVNISDAFYEFDLTSPSSG